RRASIAQGVEVPAPVAIDSKVGLPVSVDVAQNGDIAGCAAKMVLQRDAAVARGADIPCAAVVDDEVGAAVAVDIANQRHVARGAGEGGHIVGGARQPRGAPPPAPPKVYTSWAAPSMPRSTSQVPAEYKTRVLLPVPSRSPASAWVALTPGYKTRSGFGPGVI